MKTKLLNYQLLVPALAVALFPLMAMAQDEKVLFETSFEDPEEFSALGIRSSQIAAEGRTGDAALSFAQRRLSLPAAAIPINPELAYRLEGFFKAAPGSAGTPIFMMLQYCDENGVPISNFAIQPVSGTESVLKSDAKPGDKEILLEDSGQNWPTKGDFAVAFGAMEDYSDIPNPSVVEIASFAAEDGAIRIHLAEPLTAAYTDGTSVRWHQLIDPVLLGFIPSDDWEEHSLTISGSSLPGDSGDILRRSFWPGTASVRVRLGFKERAAAEEGMEIWVDDLRLTQESE